jgi:hypothetical protein
LQQNHWTPRTSLEPGSENILHKRLVDPKKILLHIKFGIIKQFVKGLPKTANLCKTFPHLSKAKLKGVFIGPDTKKTNA